MTHPKAAITQRVLVVAPQPFYEDRGTPIALRAVLETAAASGCAIDVLTYPLGKSPAIAGVRYIRIPNILRFRSVPIGFSWKKVWLDIFLFFALRKQLRQQHYDCVQALEEAGFLAVLAARGTNTAVLYDMQSSLPEQLAQLPLLDNALIKPLLLACERWLISAADFTVSSAGLASKVQTALPHARARDWKYPDSHSAATTGEASALRAKLNILETDRVVLYAGNFAEYQGVPLLISAMPQIIAAVPNAVLVLVGAQPEEGAQARKLLSRLLPDDRHRIIQRVSKQQASAYLNMADVLVSPRKTESSNLPLKILDYLAAEKPVVATATHAHQSILTQEMAVLAEPSEGALAASIIAVLTDAKKAAALTAAAKLYAQKHLGPLQFSRFVETIYADARQAHLRRRLELPSAGSSIIAATAKVSVVIPARNSGAFLKQVIDSVRAQQLQATYLEIIVVDDGSTDDTASVARQAQARVIPLAAEKSGNPAAARNAGAAAATGDVLIFLDADCIPAQGWLSALLSAHEVGAVCVGGSLALPQALPATARWDYFCGWYHAHERHAAGRVSQHPPCNLSIQRDAFLATSGFNEAPSICYSHEELAWQAQFQKSGGVMCFEPKAIAYHYNRPGFIQLIKRNYRWAYSAIESKHEAGITRFAWAYHHPVLLSLASLFLAPVSAIYIMACWLRAGRVEPLVAFPVVFIARFAYGFGMCMGSLSWIRRRHKANRLAVGAELA